MRQFYIFFVLVIFIGCSKTSKDEIYIISELKQKFPDANENSTIIFTTENDCSSCNIKNISHYLSTNKLNTSYGLLLRESEIRNVEVQELISKTSNLVKWEQTKNADFLKALGRLTETKGGIYFITFVSNDHILIKNY